MIEKILAVGPLDVNCYIVGCEKTRKAAVIDPGGDHDEINEALASEGLALCTILLTHGHWDHIGAVGELKNSHECQVLLHPGDHALYSEGPEYAEFFGYELEPPPELDGELTDGQIIGIGDLALKVIHTPGHTQGGVSFSLEESVYTGDLIFAGAVGRTDLPGGDSTMLADSIKTRIFTLPDNTRILPGHGPATTVAAEKATRIV